MAVLDCPLLKYDNGEAMLKDAVCVIWFKIIKQSLVWGKNEIAHSRKKTLTKECVQIFQTTFL